MSVSAYIFVETSHGKAKEANRKILKIKGVKSSHLVTGPYDIITLVETEDVKVLGDFLITKIQSTPGVLRTLTNVITF
jgi:DNA-binding Lrp family transcriptional regulator